MSAHLEQIYCHTNKEGGTPFSPTWKYYIGEGKVDFDLYPLQREIILKERDIIDRYEFVSDWGTKLGKDSLTSRSGDYNLLEFDNAGQLRIAIRKVYEEFVQTLEYPVLDEIYVQAWANVMRKKQKIASHIHNQTPACYLSGHVCVQVNDTSTYYKNPYTRMDWESKNVDGKITIFPSWIEHYTDAVIDDKIRMTFAFDIIAKEDWEQVSKKDHWVKL